MTSTLALEPSRPGAAAPAIELCGVRKSYGEVEALRGLDLTLRPGEIVAMLGPNGAGKSTTAELLLGMIDPDAGSVRVFGSNPSESVRAGKVGAMLQAGALLTDARVIDVLQLMHGLHRRPLPLDAVIERAAVGEFLRTRTDKLSGGQAQRLRYAMAIMPDPQLLILDEPTVGMDVEIRRAFWSSMRDFIADGRTVLFATHYLDEADEIADRIVVLARGELVADGTGAQIRSCVAGRTLTAATESLGDLGEIARLAGVISVEANGARTALHSTDSDRTLRALLTTRPQVRDLEITSARLEDAFLALTAAGTTDDQGEGR